MHIIKLLGKRKSNPIPTQAWGIGKRRDEQHIPKSKPGSFGILSITLLRSSISEPKMCHFIAKAKELQHLFPHVLTLGSQTEAPEIYIIKL